MVAELPQTAGELKPAEYNPRAIDDKALVGLAYSMDEFGDLSGLVFNVRTGNLVAGHQRTRNIPKSAKIEWINDAAGFINVRGKRFGVRVVDWSETKEKAANLAANNSAIQGTFTGAVNDLVDQIRAEEPELVDGARLFDLADQVQNSARERSDANEDPALGNAASLPSIPYETYNYVMLMFKNEMDWMVAKEHFRLEKVKDPTAPKSRLGLGQVIDGAAYMNRMLGERKEKRDGAQSGDPVPATVKRGGQGRGAVRKTNSVRGKKRAH